MTADEFQRVGETILRRHFHDVRLEWSVVKEATDALGVDVSRYSPRVDIAVGPFNTERGRDSPIPEAQLPKRLLALLDDRPQNQNPRCLLAIEVEFSGSSKHILGDILNAGALGLYGLVVGSPEVMPRIRRAERYLEVLAELGKVEPLFRNVLALSTEEFDAVFA